MAWRATATLGAEGLPDFSDRQCTVDQLRKLRPRDPDRLKAFCFGSRLDACVPYQPVPIGDDDAGKQFAINTGWIPHARDEFLNINQARGSLGRSGSSLGQVLKGGTTDTNALL
jgi:hypothetical protein